jgi:hypothetical protein
VKALLVLALIHGLVPAFGELAEAAVHYATTGHLAHAGADGGDLGDQGAEHGCSPTAHHCPCCVTQAVVAHRPDTGSPVAWRALPWSPSRLERAATRSLDPPFRPPIA